MNDQEQFKKGVRKLYRFLMLFITGFVLAAGLIVGYMYDPSFLEPKNDQLVVMAPVEEDEDRIENGIHVRTGLVDAEGLMTVVNNCTNCHSSKLVTQNRMSAERWNATIKWMQETQNLWDLGKNQEIIVNYLVTNYPPKDKGRRMILADIDWYELKD